jgi:GAF domain-containing protein
MAQGLQLPTTTDRSTLYETLAPQLEALLGDAPDAIAAMANMAAALHDAFHWHWVGFYRVVGDELVLGPFQGPVACTRIPFGKGVCGTAWKERRIVVVPDVEQFPGHIACSPLSRSEIVVPVYGPTGLVTAVLDIDSTQPDDFTTVDSQQLERMCRSLEPFL